MIHKETAEITARRIFSPVHPKNLYLFTSCKRDFSARAAMRDRWSKATTRRDAGSRGCVIGAYTRAQSACALFFLSLSRERRQGWCQNRYGALYTYPMAHSRYKAEYKCATYGCDRDPYLGIRARLSSGVMNRRVVGREVL